MKIKIINTLFCLVMLIGQAAGQTDQVSGISSLFHQYYTKFPRENLWFVPSMNVTVPGSRVPFAAVISRDPLNSASRLSRSLFLKIYDEKGQPVYLAQEKLQEDIYAGEIKLPNDIQPGQYMLFAYTSWMKNMNPEQLEAFPIYITREAEPEYEILINASSPVVSSEFPLQALISLVAWKGEPPAGIQFSVELRAGKKKIYSSKVAADMENKATITVPLPSGIQGDGSVVVSTSVKGKKLVAELPVQITEAQANVSFFPESGNLIQGVSNMMRVAVTLDSMPVGEINGEITDNAGTFLGSVNSLGQGTAVFSFTPRAGKNYFFVLKLSAGRKKTFPIPEAHRGILLQMLENTSQKARFALLKSPGYESNKLLFLLESNGFIYSFTQAEPGQIISVPVEGIPSGLARALVFDEKEQVCAERWFYVREDGFRIMAHARLSSDKKLLETDFRTMEQDGKTVPASVILSATAKSAWAGKTSYRQFHLSPLPMPGISNIPEDTDSASMNNIHYWLCGYSRPSLSWKTILNTTGERLPYESQDFLAGYLRDNNGNGLAGTKVVMKSSGGSITEKVTDEKGYFRFEPFVPESDEKITVYAPDLAGKKRYQIIWDAPFDEQLNRVAREAFRKNTFSSSRFYSSGKKESQRNEQVVVPANVSSGMPKYSPGLSVLEIIKQKKNYQIINNQIVFIGYTNSYYSQQGALIVIDGVPFGTDISILQQLPTEDVENINISTNVNDIHKYTGLNSIGIIEITTRKGVANVPSPKSEVKTSVFYYWEPLIPVRADPVVKQISIPENCSNCLLILNAFDTQGRKAMVVKSIPAL
ncbi:MAG: carboxypeptidase regulatory-like domain-containing protein [Bacteroidales bacterium]|nr:carboxypeptidase regulatory-like domain-containing protein [Bacteroidales bacterium]